MDQTVVYYGIFMRGLDKPDGGEGDGVMKWLYLF